MPIFQGLSTPQWGKFIKSRRDASDLLVMGPNPNPLRVAAPALLALASIPAGAETPAAAPANASSMIGVALNVVNIDKELAFYTEGLGMQLKARIPQRQKFEYILAFSADPADPALLLMHDTAATAPAAVQHGNGYSRLVVSVPDAQAIATRLGSRGYTHDAVRDVPGGYRIVIATDPEGYRLELVQHPAKK